MKIWKQVDWINFLFLLLTHAIAIAGTSFYILDHGVTWPAVSLFLIWSLASGLSITAGYHRLFAHGAYRAHPIVRAFYLFFGAAALQNSALKWVSDHRRHHRSVDQDEDPYNIQKGFWWAHIGWVIFKGKESSRISGVQDLERDPLLRLQHRFYVPIGILAGFGLPLGLGFLMGDPWGALLLAGFLRLVVTYHATFCVNSLAHTLGSQPYSDANSSRDSMITALITLGEGYHNFHHAFPFDYRNGVRLYQFDITKWWIRGLQVLSLATGLVRTPPEVLLRTRIILHARRMDPEGRVATLRAKIEEWMSHWVSLRQRLELWNAQKSADSRKAARGLRRQIRQARRQTREAFQEWMRAVKRLPYPAP